MTTLMLSPRLTTVILETPGKHSRVARPLVPLVCEDLLDEAAHLLQRLDLGRVAKKAGLAV